MDDDSNYQMDSVEFSERIFNILNPIDRLLNILFKIFRKQ